MKGLIDAGPHPADRDGIFPHFRPCTAPATWPTPQRPSSSSTAPAALLRDLDRDSTLTTILEWINRQIDSPWSQRPAQ